MVRIAESRCMVVWRFKSALYKTIKKFGKNLCGIKIFVENAGELESKLVNIFGDIFEGCPKLKTLTLESLEGGSGLFIKKNCLISLAWNELETLRIIKGHFLDLFDEKEVKEILPNCNVEIKECLFKIPVINK